MLLPHERPLKQTNGNNSRHEVNTKIENIEILERRVYNLENNQEERLKVLRNIEEDIMNLVVKLQQCHELFPHFDRKPKAT